MYNYLLQNKNNNLDLFDEFFPSFAYKNKALMRTDIKENDN